jgi:hypothetical protein
MHRFATVAAELAALVGWVSGELDVSRMSV